MGQRTNVPSPRLREASLGVSSHTWQWNQDGTDETVSDSTRDGMVPEAEDEATQVMLGGAGETDDLSVVGIAADEGDGAGADGIGVIGDDGGALGRTRRRKPTPRAKGRPGKGDKTDPAGDADEPTSVSADSAQDAARAVSAGKPRRGTGAKRKGSVLRKVLVAVAVVIVAAVAGTWLWGRSHYSEHLFPGWRVDGVNVGGMTAAEAAEATSVDRWSFTVDDRGESYELDADDVGFETEEIDFAAAIADQDVNMWFMHVLSPEESESVRQSTYDSDKVHESVMALACVSGEREAPVDAEVRRAEGGLSYEIVPEVEGNTVNPAVIETAVEEALAEGRPGSIDLDEADAYIHPLVYRDDPAIRSAVDTANKWMSTSITYDIDGLDSVETLGPETISQWVSVVREDPEGVDAVEADADADGDADGSEVDAETDADGDEDEEAGGEPADASDGGDEVEWAEASMSSRQVFGRDAGSSEGGFILVSETVVEDRPDERAKPTFTAVFDDAALRAWLAGIGEEYDTVGKPKTITNPNGDVKEVSGGGAYGWLTDEASEFDAVKASVEAGEQTHREFAMKQRAALPKGQNEWGNTYIEIDLTEQHLWYIRNGEVVLSYGVITGKRGYETPVMVSQVYDKQTDVTLISPWKDPKTGEPTYKTHIDVGLVISDDYQVLCHNAPWQPSYGFGSSGYHWSGGSHGCCNMRTSDCWELYETASVGDPVVVHY